MIQDDIDREVTPELAEEVPMKHIFKGSERPGHMKNCGRGFQRVEQTGGAQGGRYQKKAGASSCRHS